MPRTHERTHFFKYVSAASAERILATASLRWSAPTLFNDPFDHQTGFAFEFGVQEFGAALAEELERLVYGVAEPNFIAQKPLGQVMVMLRHSPAARDRVATMARLRRNAEETAERLPEHHLRVNALLREQLTHSRVLCVSEKHDNVVMWSHYAQQHEGAVLRLECLDEVDDNLLAARPVEYTREFPRFPSVLEWIRDLTGEGVIDYPTLFFQAAYVKHVDWTYEAEWRVHIPLMPGEPAGDGLSVYPKDQRVFSALYLGCRMSAPNQAALVALAERNFPAMRVFKMRRAEGSFALLAERIR